MIRTPKSNPRRRKALPGENDGPTIPLEKKLTPSQTRAHATFEGILSVTGDLLAEVGFERLSTNMIAERCGLTPPALYRYFPNKYAILREMGRRLLAAEDAVVFEWLAEGGTKRPATVEEDIARNADVLRRVREVARNQPGGAWILRVMRAVPILREVRAESIEAVSDAVYESLRAAKPDVNEARLRAATLLTISMTTAANELMIDNPELEEPLAGEIARMVALYYRDLLGDDRQKDSDG